MATSKNTSASGTYIVPTNSTTNTFIGTMYEPIVQDGVLKASYRVTNPGVFTQGTPVEGNTSNPNADSNA